MICRIVEMPLLRSSKFKCVKFVTVESTFVVRKFTFPERLPSIKNFYSLLWFLNESESEAMARSGSVEVGYR